VAPGFSPSNAAHPTGCFPACSIVNEGNGSKAGCDRDCDSDTDRDKLQPPGKKLKSSDSVNTDLRDRNYSAADL